MVAVPVAIIICQAAVEVAADLVGMVAAAAVGLVTATVVVEAVADLLIIKVGCYN
jgi:hypothetical protein